jgi:hypothetical protein
MEGFFLVMAPFLPEEIKSRDIDEKFFAPIFT